MYLTYYPIGTAGHRAPLLYGYAPYGYGKPYARPYVPYVPPAPVAEEVSGGISAVLEYEPATMATFLCWCAFGMLNQSRTPSKLFESTVVGILYATRLPKLSIIIALEYMNQRFSNTQTGHLAEPEVFLKVVTALVLANKFNDDNTFTNRSWCGATGLLMPAINAEEAAWLADVQWKLNVVKFQANIETLEECWRTWLDKYAAPAYAPRPAAQAYLLPQSDHHASLPLSPLYASLYAHSSPINSSPVKYESNPKYAHESNPKYADWLYQQRYRNPYAPQQSIWAYTPQQYQYAPRQSDPYYGYANPYYNCSMALC